jgi:hypothetical protein
MWFFTWPGRILIGLTIVLIALRLALPYIVKHVINDKLAHMDDYWGHVEDVDMNLYRGAFEVEGIRIVKTGGEVPIPFLRVQQLDVSILWRAIFHGDFVGEIDALGPQMNFVDGPTERQEQTGEDVDFKEVVQNMALVQIDRFAVRDGSIHFRNLHSEPPVDIYIDHIWLTAENLTNRQEISARRPARLFVNARVMNSGRLRAHARINPLARYPNFDGKVEMEGLELPELNPFLDAYGHFDAESGVVALYSEVRAVDGRLSGYVKPILEDVEILDWNREDEGFFHRLWEAIVGTGVELLENQPHDRTAVIIPIRGNASDPETNPWKIVGTLLRNAFIRAFTHGLQNSAPG